MFYFFIAVQFLFHFGNSLAQVEAGTVQDAEGLLQFPAYFFRDTCPRKADAVQADAAGGLAVGDDERRNILDDFRQAADHAVAADFDELMDAGNAANDDAVFDGDMAGQAGAVAHDDVVTDDAVMSYMRAGLEEAVVADARFFPFASRRADRDEFPKHRTVADDQVTLFAVIFQILRFRTNGTAGEKPAVLADCRPAVDSNVGHDFCSVTNGNVGPDNGIRPDFDTGTDFCLRVYNSRRMYHALRHVIRFLGH